MRILLLILLLLVAAPAEATTPLDIPALGNHRWLKMDTVATNRIQCQGWYSCAPPAVSRTNPVGRSFGGSTFGDGQIFYWGGGHASHVGNDMETYSITTNTWNQQTTPESLPTSCIATPGDPQDLTNPCRITGGAGTSAITPLGRPYVEHTYAQQSYDTSVGKYIYISPSGLWDYSVAAGWTRLTSVNPIFPSQNSNFYAYQEILVYNPDINKIIYMSTESSNFGVYEYTRSTNSWSAKVASWPANIASGYSVAAYDPVRKKYLISSWNVGSGQSNQVSSTYDPVTRAFVTLIGVPSACQRSQHIDYDTINNVFLIGKISGGVVSFCTYNMETDTWATETPLNAGPLGSVESSSPTLHYDAVNQGFWYVNVKVIQGAAQGTGGNAEGDVETWFYRYVKQGTTRTVGPGKTYATPALAAADAQAFDRIEIDAGTYTAPGSCVYWIANNLTVIGVGGRAIMDAQNSCSGGPAGGNAIWQVGDPTEADSTRNGDNITIDNIEFKNSVLNVQDRGLYIVGHGSTIRNVYIHDVDGIGLQVSGNSSVTPDPAESLRLGHHIIENSQFYDNGDQAGCGGQEHNIYVGWVESLTFRYNYSRMANCGHLLKTRAELSYILYNRLTDENDVIDNSSGMIDASQGGRVYVIGNVMRKSDCSDAGDMVIWNSSVSQQTYTLNPIQELYLINNTMDLSGVTTGTCAPLSSVRFVRIFGDGVVPISVQLKNNIFDSHGAITNQVYLNQAVPTPTVTTSNNLCYGVATDRAIYCSSLQNSNPFFVNQATFDYHLTSGSPAINAGTDPGTAAGYSLTPDHQYVHIASSETRTASGAIDIGAFETTGGVTPPSIVRVTRTQ